MRIKLDENMPHALVKFLEFAGHDVATVQAEGLSGADERRWIIDCE